MTTFTRDPEVWTKSQKEKNKLKKLRRTIKGDYGTWSSPYPYSNFIGKLKISLKKPIDDKTTFVHNVKEHNIPNIIHRYIDYEISKIYFNGKEITSSYIY